MNELFKGAYLFYFWNWRDRAALIFHTYDEFYSDEKERFRKSRKFIQRFIIRLNVEDREHAQAKQQWWHEWS